MPVWIVFISGKILEDLESVYGTQKHWISPRYIEKLEEFIHNKEARSIFLEKYVQIYNVFHEF